MLKNIFLFLILIASFFTTNAQDNTLDNQFITITEKSNNYKEYKVVKKNKLNALHRNVLDTVVTLQKRINASSTEILTQKTEINNLNQELSSTKSELIISKEKEDGIYVFGMLTNKSTYNIVAISVIVILLLIIAVLFIKFKSSFQIIKSTKDKLTETDEEFENFRQRSLEREQQIRRKLQDEINKNKS
ncbi:MAG: hypothetical protein QM499_04250 [Flavobacteriaceae bacterium]